VLTNLFFITYVRYRTVHMFKKGFNNLEGFENLICLSEIDSVTRKGDGLA